MCISWEIPLALTGIINVSIIPIFRFLQWRCAKFEQEHNLGAFQLGTCACSWPNEWLIKALSACNMQVQRAITNTKWFDYKTNMEVRSHTKCQPIRYNKLLPKCASVGLAIYSGHRPIIRPSPSTPSTRVRRDGQDPVKPLARDGATSSPKTSNSWGQHCKQEP